VFTFDVHLLPNAGAVINTDETLERGKKKRKEILWRSEKEVFKTYNYGSSFLR
jgi:hypothetical protein